MSDLSSRFPAPLGGPQLPSIEALCNLLVSLHGRGFGGRPSGRFRISRKFLRTLAGRRRLPPEMLAEVAGEMFERGFLFVDMESYFVVLEQRVFAGYRRVTVAALAQLSAQPEADSAA